jgi:ribosome-binding protein aMBF1 (putative translation factor)
MASRARKLDKSVHSAGQTAFCERMVKARKSAGLTQQELAKRLTSRNHLSPNTKPANGAST